jgi:hypothetical protein
MLVYEFSFDHKRIGDYFYNVQDCKRFAIEWLFYNYRYKTEACAWFDRIRSGMAREFDFASGGHFAIREVELNIR